MGKNNSKILQGQDGKELFRNTNKVNIAIYKMHYTYFQSAAKIYSLRKTRIPICIIFFTVPTMTALEALEYIIFHNRNFF